MSFLSTKPNRGLVVFTWAAVVDNKRRCLISLFVANHLPAPLQLTQLQYFLHHLRFSPFLNSMAHPTPPSLDGPALSISQRNRFGAHMFRACSGTRRSGWLPGENQAPAPAWHQLVFCLVQGAQVFRPSMRDPKP